MYPNRALPLGVFALIVDDISNGDNLVTHRDRFIRDKTLKALSLVCKDFINISRRHLFKTIQFTYHSEYALPRVKAQYARLKSALESSPEIAQFIKDLSVNDGSRGHSQFKESDLVFSEETQDVLPGLYNLLPNLTSFSFCPYGDLIYKSNQICSWNSIPPVFQETLFKFFSRPSITTLRLEYVLGLPASFATLFCGIPEVHLTNVSFNLDSTSPVSEDKYNIVQKPVPKLKKLKIKRIWQTSAIGPFINVLSNPNCKVAELSYVLNESDFIVTRIDPAEASRVRAKILKSCAKSLKKLEWDISESYLYTEKDLGIGISNLSNLRSFSIVIDSDHATEEGALNNLVRILSTVKPQNKIENIKISWSKLRFTELTSRQKKRGCKEPQWENLDNLLSGPNFPKLQSLHFVLESPSVDREYKALDAIEKGFKEMFPLMYEQGIISMKNVEYSSPYYVSLGSTRARAGKPWRYEENAGPGGR